MLRHNRHQRPLRRCPASGLGERGTLRPTAGSLSQIDINDKSTNRPAANSTPNTEEVQQDATTQSTSTPAQKVPRKRFVGKRTFEATRGNLSESTPATNSNIEDTSAQRAPLFPSRPC